ncbi:MAG: glycosyltransferase [Myxacorys californica WJT36-NPBG1]|jgi:glycosyltransferase involved in cell wall biosynthesis|nr:glycosyltransferase [Myxacorys californica WJT36-NPBG1]
MKPTKPIRLTSYENLSNSICLNFLNSLELQIKFTKVLSVKPHDSQDLTSWHGLVSLISVADMCDVYDIDIRQAWSDKIFQQNLVDHDWQVAILERTNMKERRHKIIVYLCDRNMKLSQKYELKKVPVEQVIGCYWRTIHHLYLSLPRNHFFIEEIAQWKDTAFNESLITSNSEYRDRKTILSSTHSKQRQEGGLRTKGIFKHSCEEKPLISIITVVFNGEKHFEQTIQSVINQTYSNLEFIIVDGRSTDNTLALIEQYEHYIDYWISEPDSGIYAAMNKGMSFALGDFVNFMNVGDLFFDFDVVRSIGFSDRRHSVCGINAFFSHLSSNLIHVKSQGKNLPHQALFMKRDDFEHHYFDTKFRYAADAELWSRFATERIEVIDQVVSLSRFGGVSTSSKCLVPRMKEHLEFEKNKLCVLLRFLPKILLLSFVSDEVVELFYFNSYSILKRMMSRILTAWRSNAPTV